MMTVIAGLVLSAVGLGLLVYSLAMAIKAARSAGWPTTRGEITAVVARTARGVDGEVLTGSKVTYRFNDGEREGTGSRVYFGDALLLAASISNRDQYGVGDIVDVSYDPMHPDSDHAVLRPGIQSELMVTVCIGVALMTLGLLVVPRP